MREYEIRVLQEGTLSAIISAEIQVSDRAAIRSAQRMARGRKFEVWRGADCIYKPDSTRYESN